jgi:signal transduction histidine kinase
LAIALFGLPLAAVVVKYSIDSERGELERSAAFVAVSAAARLARGQPPDLVATDESPVRLALYDALGHLVIGDGPAFADAPVTRAEQGAGIGSSDDINPLGDIVVAVPIRADGSLLAVLRASTPPGEVYSRVAGAWLLMTGLAGCVLLAVWLVARRLAARLSRPLEDLALSAHALGDGDFSVRFPHAAVAEIDSLAEALNSTATRLSDLVSRERAFTADASHQLRTPLTALRLGLEVALDDPGQDPRQAIATAVTATDRLQHTVHDLLTLARDSARPNHPLPLKTLLNELVEIRHPQLAAQDRALTITTHPSLPVSSASAAAVRQILAVLVDNATAHGSGTVTITVRDATGALAIDVSDHGHITTPTEELFSRHHPTATGHGIGLALARRLAEAEGGRLRLSTPRPTTFTLLLPTLPSTAADRCKSGTMVTPAGVSVEVCKPWP